MRAHKNSVRSARTLGRAQLSAVARHTASDKHWRARGRLATQLPFHRGSLERERPWTHASHAKSSGIRLPPSLAPRVGCRHVGPAVLLDHADVTDSSPQLPASHPDAVKRVSDAMDLLGDSVRFTCLDPQPASHSGVFVSEIESATCIEALGQYGTGLIAQVVGVDLRLSDALFGNSPGFRDTLKRNVERTVGASNTISANFRAYQRDPWITEALGHLLVALASREANHCVPGTVHALTLPHTQVREQGLDLVGVAELDGGVALCIAESKASEGSPGSQLSKAVKLFKAIDARDRDNDLLQALNIFRNYLTAEIRAELPEAMWSRDRLYAPVISFRTGLDPSTERPTTLGQLNPPSHQRRLICVRLEDYGAFFNGVADAMRAAVASYP